MCSPKAYDTQRALGIFSLIGQTPSRAAADAPPAGRQDQCPSCATCRAPPARYLAGAKIVEDVLSPASGDLGLAISPFPQRPLPDRPAVRRRDGEPTVGDHPPDRPVAALPRMQTLP